MTEVLFLFDKRNYLECNNSYRGAERQEFYRGDYTIEGGSVIDVRADRRTAGPYSIIRVRSKSPMSFRRSWSHIREDAIDVAVLWFVKRGSLSITHSSGCTVAEAGDFVVTKSLTPFFIECRVGDDSSYETLQIVVPNHLLRLFFPDGTTTGFCISAQGREFAIAERILLEVFEDPGEVPDQIAQHLVDSTLQLLSDAIRERHVHGVSRQSISDKRLDDVLKYIEVHLCDSHLSAATIAEGCGISIRYLFFLLKQHGSSLSTLVWSKRVEVARQWLATTTPEEAPISEIAYKVGFKNPQHFSRRFKRTFHKSPSDCRSSSCRVVLAAADQASEEPVP